MQKGIAGVSLFVGLLILWSPLQAQRIEVGVRGGSSHITHPTFSGHYRSGRTLEVTAAYPFHSNLSSLAEISYTRHPRNLEAVRSSPFIDPALEVGGGDLSIVSASIGVRTAVPLVGQLKGYGTFTAGLYRGDAERLTFEGPGAGKIDTVGSLWWHPGVGLEGGLLIEVLSRGKLFVAPAFTKLFADLDSTSRDGYHAISLQGGVSIEM